MIAFGRRTRSTLLCVVLAGCASRSDLGEGWTRRLAVPPGSSLPQEPFAKDQTITLFALSQTRMTKQQFFLAGSGYVAIDGGGKTFAGMNRALDPYLEVTIVNGGRPLDECRTLLVQESLSQNAIRISGKGFFTSRSGVNDRQLGVVLLDTLFGCSLVARR